MFHSSLGDRIAAVRDRLPQVRLWLAVDDDPAESGADHIGEGYEAALAAAVPAPRMGRSEHDLTLLYTGGTIGMPKSVMGEVGNGVRAGLAGLGPLIGMKAATSATAVDAAARLAAEGTQLGSIVPCRSCTGPAWASAARRRCRSAARSCSSRGAASILGRCGRWWPGSR